MALAIEIISNLQLEDPSKKTFEHKKYTYGSYKTARHNFNKK